MQSLPVLQPPLVPPPHVPPPPVQAPLLPPLPRPQPLRRSGRVRRRPERFNQ